MHFLQKSFYIIKIWIYGENIKKEKYIEKKSYLGWGTWFYYSHMMV